MTETHLPGAPSPSPKRVRGTSALLFTSLGLLIAAGLAGGLDASGRIGSWQVAGDLSLVTLLGPVFFVAALAVSTAAVMRHAFLSLRSRAREYPEGSLNKGAHVVASVALLVLLGFVLLGIIWWATTGALA